MAFEAYCAITEPIYHTHRDKNYFAASWKGLLHDRVTASTNIRAIIRATYLRYSHRSHGLNRGQFIGQHVLRLCPHHYATARANSFRVTPSRKRDCMSRSTDTVGSADSILATRD
jgi:hypothetical protein